VIKQLHDWLLKFSHKDERHPGEYKKLSNNVEAFDETGKSVGVIFQTASPFETPMKMQELVLWTKESLENKSLHPLLVIGVFVVVFLAIHPFQDGNGRLSRILTTLLLLKSGYTYVQYTSLESIIEHNKENYYLALRTTQGSLITSTPDLYSWLIFFLRSMQKQKIHLEKKAKLSKNTHLHISAISSQISTLLIEHGRLSIGQIESITQINKNTLKKQLIKLVDSGTILRLGKGRATWYALP
jgi:Fic family protein